MGVFQWWQLPLHCCSSVACITPSPLPSLFPVSSTGTWHSCQSCTISEAAGAARACPAIFPFLSSFSPHPLWWFLCISPHYLKSSVSTSLFMVHSVFTPGFLFSVWLIGVSLLILYLSTSCSVRLPSNLIFVSFVSLSYRCKEGYHGLRCDQFVPKTDAILSDPSMLTFLFVLYMQQYVLICNMKTDS